MGRHASDLLTKARDELMSHTVRCAVLDAEQADRVEWLEETIEYIAGRYPGLSDLELTQLEAIGRQYIKPVIAHGAGFDAVHDRRPDPIAEDVVAVETDAVKAVSVETEAVGTDAVGPDAVVKDAIETDAIETDVPEAVDDDAGMVLAGSGAV